LIGVVTILLAFLPRPKTNTSAVSMPTETTTTTVYKVKPKEVVVSQAQVEKRINYFCNVRQFAKTDCDYIKALSWLESWWGKCQRIFDSNAKYSYGIFHYQLETFIRQGIKYGFLDKDVTKEEAEKKIYDIDIQIPLTMCLYKDKQSQSHWVLSSQKIKKQGLENILKIAYNSVQE